jgi:hypothetical protein
MSIKYVLAKIEIPIELDERGELKLLDEYMTMNIEEGSKPLVKQKLNVLTQDIISLLKVKSDEPEEKVLEDPEEPQEPEELFIQKDEIKKRKKGGYQQSFKKKRHSHNKTSANQKFKISLMEKVFGGI